MKRKTTMGIAMLMLLSCTLSAQTNIIGRTVDSAGSPVSFANVLLLNPADSSLIQGELSDENGYFSMNASPGTECILSSSFIGFSTNYTEVFRISTQSPMEMGEIILTEGLELDEVQVVARKPLFEQKIDRMVVNVANSLSSSGLTALDVLERSPGVSISRQTNNIALLGKQGVGVMINGKVSYQPVDGIIQMLNGMSSENIEKIELITSPPAHLDAEGNAGFINIVLLNNPEEGFNANTSLNAGYGRGETGSANLNFNYRKSKMNFSGSYSYFLQSQPQLFKNFRETTILNEFTESNTISERDPTQLNHNLRLGGDFVLSERTTIGILLSAYDNKWTMDADNFFTEHINNQRSDSIYLFNTERNQWKHIMGNFNIEHKLNKGNSLTLNLDRLYYEDENPVLYYLDFYDSQNNLYNQNQIRSDKYTPIDINVLKLDYSAKVSPKFTFQSGIKAVLSDITNEVLFDELIDDEWRINDRFSNESDLTEKILAAYFSSDIKLDKNQNLKLGLRYEYTDSELNTASMGRVVDREFGKLFPTVHYINQFAENQSFGIAYNKRITRPTFNQMAPFTIFLDPNTIYIGNTSLQPAVSDNVKLDYRYNSINLSIQYSREDSTIARFQDKFLLEEGIQAVEPVNLSSSKILSASLSFPVYISKFWEMQNNMISQWQQTNSFYEGNNLQFDNSVLEINSTQSFLLGQGITLELKAEYTTGNLNGRSKLNAYGMLDIGAQKSFDNGSSLRFAITDLFESNRWDIETDLREEGFYVNRFYDFSVRTFSLSYSFNFGSNSVKSLRDRKTGSEEEQRRVN